MGVVKSYTTRVGSGPLPTEQLNEIGEALRKSPQALAYPVISSKTLTAIRRENGERSGRFHGPSPQMVRRALSTLYGGAAVQY